MVHFELGKRGNFAHLPKLTDQPHYTVIVTKELPVQRTASTISAGTPYQTIPAHIKPWRSPTFNVGLDFSPFGPQRRKTVGPKNFSLLTRFRSFVNGFRIKPAVISVISWMTDFMRGARRSFVTKTRMVFTSASLAGDVVWCRVTWCHQSTTRRLQRLVVLAERLRASTTLHQRTQCERPRPSARLHRGVTTDRTVHYHLMFTLSCRM